MTDEQQPEAPPEESTHFKRPDRGPKLTPEENEAERKKVLDKLSHDLRLEEKDFG